MKPVALDSHGLEAARDGQEPGHARHAVVKRRVKAGHLRQLRIALDGTPRSAQFRAADDPGRRS